MDLTVVAIPGYFSTMGAEYLYLRRRAEELGPTAADYERRDTVASLTMGVGSLVAPFVLPRLLKPLTPGKGRYGTALLVAVTGAAAVTTIADVLARLEEQTSVVDEAGTGETGQSAGTAIGETVPPEGTAARAAEQRIGNRQFRRRIAESARKVAAVGGVATVIGGGVAICSTWASRTTTQRMWNRRFVRDLGTGPLALAAAVLGWDFIYYWNHRLMHESRFMWAIHVVHHSSERYNLSTALRQPVAEALGTFVPYGSLALVGIRPAMIETARSINLLYQYWIHTDTIDRLGPAEGVLNTPSAHRVHHGSNSRYIDRNHGSILILWDRLFGTFEEEGEPVVYGLTKNINTFNPARIATHEHVEMLRDVARSRTWRDRLSYVVRGPGWANRRNVERDQTGGVSPARPDPEVDVDVDVVELLATEPRVDTRRVLRVSL
ncbi:MAG TPA: sterol desaturase family protein [Acidimicrobiales bacterium]|nr:sterol desaturase family protein [Acidimicrobiales bacterium]